MNHGLTKDERMAWARLCKRIPDLQDGLEHFVCLEAAQQLGKENIRATIGRTIGGWKATLVLYSPNVENFYQNFDVGTFLTMDEAGDRVIAEKEELWKQYNTAIQTIQAQPRRKSSHPALGRKPGNEEE